MYSSEQKFSLPDSLLIKDCILKKTVSDEQIYLFAFDTLKQEKTTVQGKGMLKIFRYSKKNFEYKSEHQFSSTIR